MNLAGWCIRNNRTAIVFFALLAMLGFRAYRSVPRLEAPEFTIRTALIVTYLPGASPQKVEQLVTDKIESKLQEIPEVEKIESQSMTGVSLILVDVGEQYSDMAPIWQKLRNKVADLQPLLPEGAQGPYVNDEFGDVFPVLVAVVGDGFTYRELKQQADAVRDTLLRNPHVAKVEIWGAQEERIYVEFSNARLAETGITPQEIAGAIASQNILKSGGHAKVGPERIIVEPTGAFRSLDDLRFLSLRARGQPDTMYLQDLATIRRGYVDPPQVLTRYNGEMCLVLAVSMIAGGKVTDMAPSVVAQVRELQATMPWGVDLIPFFSQEKYVTRSINDFMVNLLEAFGFVVVIMFIFTGLRTGLITGALVPMAMLMCFMFMPVFKISLQQVSIAALIIALGMLVDNGVVVSENLLVRLSRGEERLAAIEAAIRELWLPLLTSSLTTICAFLPIAWAKSGVGEYCLSLFQVVSLTLLCSWVLSLTFIPVLCYYFLKAEKAHQTFESRSYQIYRKLLVWSLRRRGLFLGIVLVAFAVATWGFRFVPSVFFPPNEREMLLVDFWQPYGTDVTTTAERLTSLEQFLLRRTNEVESVASFIGSGGPRWYLGLNLEQDNPNYAHVVITLTGLQHVSAMREAIAEHLEKEHPDCRYAIKQLENGVPVGAPVKIYLSGPDIHTIYALRERIQQTMESVPGIVNVRDDWGEWIKKLKIVVHQEKARQAGLTSEDVAISLETQISGLPVTEYREGRDLIPVIFRSEPLYREDLGHIESLSVYSYLLGHNVPLLQVASAELEWQPSNIRRRNRSRTMALMADVLGRYASAVLADVVPRLEALQRQADWPSGYRMEFGGENAESAKAQGSIMAVLPLAMGLLTLILVGQFNSIRRPLIILLTIPPMICGIVPGLLITRVAFGFMAFLGLISLMGIIVNNAIMMIDRIEIEKRNGQSLLDALVVAAQRRLRPILATATTTVIGLVPLSLQGGEMWRPMANTIMFGLAFSTLLTLLLCPVLYAVFFRIRCEEYEWDRSVLAKTENE